MEGLFNFVQNNFLAGRQFHDFDDANKQAVTWCDKINAAFSRKLHASRRELFAHEQLLLKPLPIWRPDVYRLLTRMVDLEGYVHVHGYCYEMPCRLIGRRLEVRETKRGLLFFDGPRLVTTHERRHDGPRRVPLPEAQRERRKRHRQQRTAAEQEQLRTELPQLSDYITRLCKRAARGRAMDRLRRLRRMLRDYPHAPLMKALADADHYGLYDLDRVERMALNNIQGDFFPHCGRNGNDQGED